MDFKRLAKEDRGKPGGELREDHFSLEPKNYHSAIGGHAICSAQ